MGSVDKLVVGLGNPEGSYARTRHNVGAELVRQVVSSLGGTFRSEKELRASVVYLEVGGVRVAFAVPKTYMNLSGDPVRRLCKKVGVELEKMLVVFDDLETNFGEHKLAFDGGARGHNGIRSIHSALQSKNFFQLRFGIGRPASGDIAEYVLSRFTADEMSALTGGALSGAAETICKWVLGEIE